MKLLTAWVKKNMFMTVIINVWLLTHITLYINFYLGFGEGNPPPTERMSIQILLDFVQHFCELFNYAFISAVETMYE